MTRFLPRFPAAPVAILLLSSVGTPVFGMQTANAAPARQPHCANVGADVVGSFVTEAAARFGIPETWVRAVMRMESGGDRCVISRAGALGLMQLMPRTYAELQSRYALGPDPFDAHDNVVAGAAYLREMWDRFGASGFLAAYNTGPGRFQDHLVTGRPLTNATKAYVAALEPATVGAPGATDVTFRRRSPLQPPSLFVQIGGASTGSSTPFADPSRDVSSASSSSAGRQPPALFAVVSAPEAP